MGGPDRRRARGSAGGEWLYDAVRPLLAERADLLVWLDLPTTVVMTQVLHRTWVRRRHRTVLWNGNVEPPWRTLLTRREHVVRLAWSTRQAARVRVAALLAHDPDVVVVRLTSHHGARRWLDGPLLAASAG